MMYTFHTCTHGNSVSNASVMPNPARKIGVNPTLGLITEPVKGPTGVCSDKNRMSETIDSSITQKDIPHEILPPPDLGWPQYRV